MTKPGRLWFPLDVNFWSDPDVIAVGESAAILFQRMIAYSKQHELDGWVPTRYVREAGGRWWSKHVAKLAERGLVALATDACPSSDGRRDVSASEECLRIVAFLSWNDSSDDIEQRREIAREKKRLQRSAKVDVPAGHNPSVPEHREEIEKRHIQPNPDRPLRLGVEPHVVLQAHKAGWVAKYRRTYTEIGGLQNEDVTIVCKLAQSEEDFHRTLKAFWLDVRSGLGDRPHSLKDLAKGYGRLAIHGPADEYKKPLVPNQQTVKSPEQERRDQAKQRLSRARQAGETAEVLAELQKRLDEADRALAATRAKAS